MTESVVFLHYWKLLALPLPIWLCVDHNFPVINTLNGTVAIAWLCHGMIITAGILAYRRGYHLALFGIAWFYLTLTPYLFVPEADTMVEYKTYLPAIGLVLLCKEGLDQLIIRKRFAVAISASLLVMTIFSLGTIFRNRVYATEISFWSDAIDKYPQSSRAYNNRGLAWAEAGNLDKAIEDYRQGLAVQADNALILANLGDAHLKRKEINLAQIFYAKLIQIKAESAEGYFRTGNVLALQGQWPAALAAYREAIRFDRDNADLLYNIGLAFAQNRDHLQAISHLKRLIAKKPGHVKGLSLLGAQYLLLNQLEKARSFLDEAIKINTGDADALHNRALCAYLMKNTEEAFSYARQLAKHDQARGEALLKRLGGGH